MDPAKITEKEYLNRFNRIQQLDKEKEIKFAQYLGDKAMTEQEIKFEEDLVAELAKARLQALRKGTTGRVNP